MLEVVVGRGSFGWNAEGGWGAALEWATSVEVDHGNLVVKTEEGD